MKKVLTSFEESEIFLVGVEFVSVHIIKLEVFLLGT